MALDAVGRSISHLPWFRVRVLGLPPRCSVRVGFGRWLCLTVCGAREFFPGSAIRGLAPAAVGISYSSPVLEADSFRKLGRGMLGGGGPRGRDLLQIDQPHPDKQDRTEEPCSAALDNFRHHHLHRHHSSRHSSQPLHLVQRFCSFGYCAGAALPNH